MFAVERLLGCDPMAVVEVVAVTVDPGWELVHRSREWGWSYDPRIITCVWREFLSVPDPINIFVLDVGCGVGAQAFELIRWGFSVAGIDAAPSALSRARERAEILTINKTMPGRLRFAQMDVCDLKFGDGSFHLAIDGCCIECLSDDDAVIALGEIARVLKPDGYFVSIAKAVGWKPVPERDVGNGSRVLTDGGVRNLYGTAFEDVRFTLDVRTDGVPQQVPEWVIECRRPRHG
jgi:SAM-dependent methyltransferase